MNIACCYFPTQTILLDDNANFLESMKFSLGKNNVIKAFKDSDEAIKYVAETAVEPFTRRCLHRPEEQKINHRIIDVEVDAIVKEMYNPKRFMENTVIVIDYAMPSMHGLEVCQALRHLPIKKIMLTGEAEDKIAVQAFNQGLIQKFIRKGGPSSVVASAILELQKKYFVDQSTIVIDSLTRNMDYPPSCLDDPIFIQFFNDFCDKQKYTEFYLLDPMGSFLFLDEHAKPTFLIVKDEDGMQEGFEMADLNDTPVSSELLNALKNKEKLLYFFDKSMQKQTDPKTWDRYAHKATKITGRDNYYYAITSDPELYDIARNKILPYSDYLRSL
ncbi:MAG: response regulator [Gammaproteobacteria bacterium]|jgi:CheY-like chemotaxis protein